MDTKGLVFLSGVVAGCGIMLLFVRRSRPLEEDDSWDLKPYSPNGDRAKAIARVTPYFPFKGIPRFYDIGGFLKHPDIFAEAIEAFVERYRGKEIDKIFGFDARGFVIGAPLALALKLPFYMLRKQGKMPNTVSSDPYSKEYAGDDCLCIPRGSVSTGDRVLLIDDIVATGGTLSAGITLMKALGGQVVECACVVKLSLLRPEELLEEKGHGEVSVWALMDESILTLNGLADPAIDTEGYKDDGETH